MTMEISPPNFPISAAKTFLARPDHADILGRIPWRA